MGTEGHDLNQDRQLQQLESALGADLRRALRPEAAEPPARVDAAVAEMIRTRSGEVRRQLAAGRTRRWPVWAAAAAALLLAAGVWTAAVMGRGAGARRPDIIDAYLLERRIESGARLDAASDQNGDGRVDRADVEALARRAVEVRRKEGA
ncbi:MAG TPA: hypothetical protein PK280_17025 [Planctomycetota bacterium]|nr:hypothetical protein [Planctomycetota bacterium]